MNIKYLKKVKSLLILYSIAFVLFYYYPSFLTGIAIFLVFIAYLLYDTNLGLSVILFTLPFDIYIQENMSIILLGLNPIIIFLTFFLFKYILELLLKRKKIILHKPTILFISLFILMNFFALILNSSQITLASSYYGMLLACLLLLLIFLTNSINSKTFFFSFIYSLIIVSFTVIICLIPDFTDITSGDILRLRLSGSIRNITNTVAPSVIIILYILNSRSQYVDEYMKIFQSKNMLRLIMFLGISALTLTGSRGTIYALVLAFIVLLLLNYRISLKKITFIILIVLFSITANLESISLPNPVKRLLSTENDIRMEIWKNAFSQTNFHGLIFGRGLNRFQELSAAGGFIAKYTGEAWYSHSIYLDILFSAGILTLILFLLYIMYHLKESIINRSRLGTVLLVYLSLVYFTHGQVISTSFWITLALVAGANKWFVNDIKTIDNIKE